MAVRGGVECDYEWNCCWRRGGDRSRNHVGPITKSDLDPKNQMRLIRLENARTSLM